jgi:uncharacterized protein
VTIAVYQPVSQAERIDSLDVIRGVALLGILLMNILSFGFPFAAYFNPTVMGGATGANLAAFAVQYILWDGKMRALFSLCFGAGVILLTRRGDSLSVADIYYRRTLWLLLFGILHAYLIWYGDILYPYALCALVLFPLRQFRPRTLLIIASILCAIMTAGSFFQAKEMRETRDKALAANQAEKDGKTLTDEQKQAQHDWTDTLRFTSPSPEDVRKEVAAYAGYYSDAVKERAKILKRWHGKPFYSPAWFDMYMIMLVGMALMKLDVLSASRSARFYWTIIAAGFLIAIPVNSLAFWQFYKSGFEPLTMPVYLSTYHIGRAGLALAYLSIFMLICKAGILRWLTRGLANIGQMAFSNYISHSVICSFIFYGYGAGMIGKFERHQLYMIVPAIWLFNFIFSALWLRYFRFGPLEWAWRSLTYWQRQPMRRTLPLISIEESSCQTKPEEDLSALA